MPKTTVNSYKLAEQLLLLISIESIGHTAGWEGLSTMCVYRFHFLPSFYLYTNRTIEEQLKTHSAEAARMPGSITDGNHQKESSRTVCGVTKKTRKSVSNRWLLCLHICLDLTGPFRIKRLMNNMAEMKEYRA